jgi:outer membrane protein OmpA-like peptidoglycan-associated protein
MKILIVSALILPLVACGPRVFEGQTAKVIESAAPPPVVEAPKPVEPRVEITDDKIIIREKIQFDYAKAKIKSASDSLLAEVAQVMNENPRLAKIRIEGHASSEGDDRYNMKLSEKRAKAVRDHLIKHGKVDAARLVAEGFGETQPIDESDTDTARESNRRVEFTILEQDYVETKKIINPVTGQTKTETIEHKAEGE